MLKAILLLCLSVSVMAEELTSEESQIDLLVQTTEKSLFQIKTLQEYHKKFRAQEAICLQSPDDIEALYILSEYALKLLTSIQQERIEPYFCSSFLEELIKLSQPAKNNAIPPIVTP